MIERTIIQIILGVLVGLILSDMGYDVTTWQWWMIIVLMAVSYINGYNEARDKIREILEEFDDED